jgi:aminoglycoside phosphotransferase (APT) family kinase protein
MAPLHQDAINIQNVEAVVNQIFPSHQIYVEPTSGGISSRVYKITSGSEIFYLRLLPEPHDSFASEVVVHNKLREMHIKVPEIIYFDHYNKILKRSVMIITEIKGLPISQSSSIGEDKMKIVVREAGRDLANINTLLVDGFGWLRGQEESESL